MKLQKGMESTGCLLDSGISKVPCVLSLVRVPTLQISHVQLRLRVQAAVYASSDRTENAGAFRQGSLLLAQCVERFP